MTRLSTDLTTSVKIEKRVAFVSVLLHLVNLSCNIYSNFQRNIELAIPNVKVVIKAICPERNAI